MTGIVPPTRNTDCQPNWRITAAATQPATAEPKENPQNIVMTAAFRVRFGMYSEPKAIRDRTKNQSSDHHPERSARNHGTESHPRNVKLGAERRRNEAHHLSIETIDEDDHGAHRGNQQLIPGEWLLIDELAYVEDGYLSQDGVTISKNGCYL